jgi:Arc/MetJ-type ribon-helix-helix transcriptional regulator
MEQDAMVTIAARIPSEHAEIIRRHCGNQYKGMSDGIRMAVALLVANLTADYLREQLEGGVNEA